MKELVLLRHGQSEWNRQNRFTGWTDVGLSEKGVLEAERSGAILKKNGFSFDVAYTSFLKRSVQTLRIVLEVMGLESLPVRASWRLNERHYGALQGLDKDETALKFGREQVQLWRRSYDIAPPALDENDVRYPGNSGKYKSVPPDEIPLTESLKDTVKRFMPYWEEQILPDLREKKKVLISAHGNSLRALVKHLDGISDEDVPSLEIPTGVPLVYDMDDENRAVRSYYLDGTDQVKNVFEKSLDKEQHND